MYWYLTLALLVDAISRQLLSPNRRISLVQYYYQTMKISFHEKSMTTINKRKLTSIPMIDNQKSSHQLIGIGLVVVLLTLNTVNDAWLEASFIVYQAQGPFFPFYLPRSTHIPL